VTDTGELLLVVIDGRRPGYSVGATLPEAARVMQSLGARDALNLDGGGSSAMVVRGRVVNRPSDPGGERAVGDGVFAAR
jgi:exopolysaccharide biosynthesis protein